MQMLSSVKALAAVIAFSAVVLPGANAARAAECAHAQTGPVGTAVAPTCTTPGLTAGVKCLNCGFEVSAQQPLAALGHLWDDGVVTTPATTSTPGVRTLTCTRVVNGKTCGATTTVEIPVIGGSGVAKNLSPADTTVTIPSAAQIALMSAHVVDNATAAVALSKLGTVTPQAVKLSWQGTDGKCTVTVTRKPDVNEPTAKVFGTWTTSSGAVNVYNLEIGRTYEWSVKSSAGTATATFRTADQRPRIINAGSVGNTRDIGGWRGWHGRRIRQGHIIRSEQINHNGSGDAGAAAVSADAFATFNDLLGIKTDVDLRFDTETVNMTKSPLDRDRNPPLVDWVKIAHFQQYAVPSDTKYKVLFDPALDVTRHPIDVHCAGGKDRAGTYIAFVEMLLGMSEEDVWRDYLLSGTRDDRMEGMMTGFKQLYLGDTLMEKAERVFMEMGFTKAELDAFREAMLEPEDGTHWHDFGEWTYTVEPTCTNAGKRQHTCHNAGCPFAGGVEVENVPALGHDWNAFTVTKAPTTSAAGTATHTCRRCGGSETKTLTKLSTAGTPGAADTGSATYTWAGAEVGLWNNTTYWTPGSGAKCGVPNGAASVAAFAADAVCSVDGQGGTYAVGGLTLNKRAKVTIANARLAGKFNLSTPSSGALTLSDVQMDMGGGEFAFVDGDLIIEKNSSFSNYKLSTGLSSRNPRVLVRDGNTTFNGGIGFVHGGSATINDFVVDNANVTVTGGMTFQNARLRPNTVYPIIKVRNGGTVTAASLSCYYSVVKERTPFRLGYELPAGGFASAPITVTGEADLQAAIIVEVDATKCGSGTYPLLTAGTLKLPANGVNDFVLHAKTANGLKAQLALSGKTINLVLGNGETCKHTSYTTLPAVAATCMDAGRTVGKKCDSCGLIFEGYQSVPSLGGHLWNAGTVTKDPSCSAAGEKTFACTRAGCEATKTEPIAKTAHNFVEGECTVCHAKEGGGGGEGEGDDDDDGGGTCAEPTETKTLSDGSTVMIFRSTEGTLEFNKPAGVTEIQYLLVGGGGGAGASYTATGGAGGAGGGGAGGFREGKLTVSSAALKGTVVVGKGGACGASTAESTVTPTNGEGSSLTLGGQTVAVGGGTHGGGYKIRTASDPLASPAATDASSGGGGGAGGVAGTVNCAANVFGNAGGAGPSATIKYGCGGGGAGAQGAAATSTASGAGGAGKESTITGAGVTYAAGGAGGSSSAVAAAVAASTGNGGNGGHGAASGTHGASGIVIIRFGGTGGGGDPEPTCDHEGFVVTDAAVAATCTATGLTEGSHCSNCGAVLVAQQQIPALGHDWDEGIVTTEPTATTDGVKTYTCQRAGCGATKTERIPATGGGDELDDPPSPPVGGDWGYELTLAGGDVVRVYTNTAGTVEWPVPSGVTSVRYLVVGGGGGGGYGGGGGGYALEDTASVQPGSVLTVSVGAGGAGGADGANGTRGRDSSLSGTLEVTAEGGGYGGGVDQDGGVGGCGGGGAKNYSGGSCTQGPSGYGGTGGGTSYSGSGAGVTGRNQSAKEKMSEGGAGLVSSITGAEVEYGKGGQGQTTSTPVKGTAGADGTGTGGGGSRSGAGAKGGDGVVILRYSPAGGGNDPACDHEGFVVTDAAVAATCEATGLTEGSHCSKCGTIIVAQVVTDMIPHHFEDGECTVCHTKDPSVHGEDWGYERTMEDGSILRVYTNTADTLTWQVPAAGIQLRYLVVGGGGGGGTGIADENKFGGGGGAGGFARGWTEVAGGATLEIAVGAGGAGATDSRAAATLAGHGGASSLALAGGAALASVEGGGAGGSYGSYANANGACGGGAGRNGKIGTGSQGGNGGPGSAGSGVGGGGGGMAGDGILLEGGAGVADDITGASVVYSAGGFGGKANRTPVAGADGTGEGGDGAAGALVGAKGGDGVVILRYVVIDATCAHAETQTVGETVAATCEQDGARHGVQCKACGYWLEMPSVLPALGHDFDENDVCRHCGLNRIETLPENAKNLYFASYWQNHVVIQRGKPVTVWGKDTAGRTVTVYFGGQTATGVADASGVWAATFAEPFALSATPRTLTIADNVNEVRHIQDVLVGDVWLAGGQSNMDRTFEEDKGEFQSVRDFCAADAGIRFRRVARDRKTEEQSFDLPTNGGSTLGVNWATCASEETRNSVSATALNFATCLRKRHAEDGQDIPIGVVQVSFGGTAIREHIAAPALAAAGYETAERYDSQVWNAMIAPLHRVNFTGVIWYQGCTDAATKTAEDYAALMKVLVADWRAHWGADLPFYATQIGFPGTTTARGIDHRPAPTLTPGEHNYAQIREGQRLWCARETGLHGLAIVCDGALEALHPHDKRLPGERLSRWALRDVYGLDVEPRGPTFAKAVCETAGRVRVTFASGTALGLTTGVYHPATDSALGFFETTTAPVVGFALCGADGEWKEATAVIDGESVLLSADGVTEPAKFHYGSWCMTRKADGTQYINLYNGAGLPLSPIAPQDIETSGGEEEITNPAFIGGGDADNAALAKVKAWTAANGVTVAGINAMAFTRQAANGFWIPADEMAEKFLLNLPPSATAEELAAEKAAFRFTAITPGEEPTVFEPERGYNGEVKILRSAAVDGTYSIDAVESDGHLFYKAVLVR